MNKGDFLWAGLLAAISAGLLIPASHEAFVALTRTYPLALGFIKVGILATMGELLARRLATKSWEMPIGVPWRFVVWGLFGVSFAIVFELFATGTAGVLQKGLLPSVTEGFSGKLCLAFWTSALMNSIFAPTFMALHRITDGMIESGQGTFKGIVSACPIEVSRKVDWPSFFSFVVLKTIPFFWIPAHTITFLLPPEYRVLMAAYLSIALGAILAQVRRT